MISVSFLIMNIVSGRDDVIENDHNRRNQLEYYLFFNKLEHLIQSLKAAKYPIVYIPKNVKHGQD